MTERTYQENVRFFIQNYLVSIKRNLRNGNWTLIAKVNGEYYKFIDEYYDDVIAKALNLIVYKIV